MEPDTRVFLSYSTLDRSLATTLMGALEDRLPVWIDRGRLAGGDLLRPAIEQAITGAIGLVVLLTEHSVKSGWVQHEVAFAQSLGCRVVPVFHGIAIESLPAPFAESVGGMVAIALEPSLETARIRILSALGLDPLGEPAELVLDFSEAALVEQQEGETKITRVEAIMRCGDRVGRFRSPLGLLEAEQVRWYLEQYFKWPADEFEQRARGIEEQLKRWGRDLWDAVLAALGMAEDFEAWLEASEKPRRRILSLRVIPPDPDRDGSDGPGIAALLALPWELLRDREGWLFHAHDITLRRLLPGGRGVPPSSAPIRVLAVVARPEQAGLIDPRASATALLEAVTPLGTAVEVEFLRPPTVPALVARLKSERYHVLHFDGHGVYDPRTGLGCLCFEHEDEEKRRAGEPHTIPGTELREQMGKVPLPLAFLEACQSAQEGENPGSAVASALLAAGAGSVIAMSHSVLVETARRFTAALYKGLCEGLTVGGAVTRARTDLYLRRERGKAGHGLPLELHDWFVPVLLQRGEDRPLLPGGVHLHPPDSGVEAARAFAVHSLPALQHGFVGRWREHLALDRAFEPGGSQRIGLIVGLGGQGKTTLAAEMGRWLYRSNRFPGGVGFVSMESLSDLMGVLSGLGTALLPDFAAKDVEQAKRVLLGHLRVKETLIVFDNFESVLPPAPDAPRAEQWQHEPEFLKALLELAHELAHAGQSRVLITSREAIDDDRFRNGRTTCVLTLGGLSRNEAIELVGEICRHQKIRPSAAKEEDLAELVDAVACHPRSLVLLPALLRDTGVAGVTGKLHGLMAELERKYPGQREKSLYASLKLSLDRLPRGLRVKLGPLGLLRVGVSLPVMGLLLKLEENSIHPFIEALADRALLIPEGPYLRFHPALAPFLEAELRSERPAEVEALWTRVVEAYVGLVGALYPMQYGPQAALATGLAGRELPNLLRVLDHLATATDTAGLDQAIDLAIRLEGLLQNTAHHRALAGVAEVRSRLATRRGADGGWSKAQYLAARAAIDRLLEAGRLGQALPAAEALVRQSEAAGPTAYAGADYDGAMAHVSLGRVLERAGQPEAALVAIETARHRFLALTSNRDAARMASACLTEAGDCLLALGQLEAAAGKYEEAIKLDRERGDLRDVAAGEGQLATVRMLQGKFAEALRGWQTARETFTTLGEPSAVATAWHQIGMVHHKANQLEAAEQAYRQSLAIKQGRGDRAGAATTMSQLAMVANRAGRLEEAVAWERRGLELEVALGRRQGEAISRNNLANRFRRLGRLAEAETEVRQAIAILEALGLGAQPWKSWDILHHIARDRGDPTTAAAARTQAMDWYRRYRAQGGHPQTPAAPLFAATTQAVAADPTARTALLAQFTQLAADPGWAEGVRLLTALTALLQGDPATTRAALPDLDYDDAVELERLLAGTWP